MDSKRKEFKPIFSRSQVIDRMAFMNWRFGQAEDDFMLMVNIAEGYIDASISLIETCLMDNKDKKADIFILPIFMTFNHGIEVYLKSLIYLVELIQGVDAKVSGNHDIQQLYNTLNARIKSYRSESWKDYQETTQNLKSYINELYSKISNKEGKPGMDFSRYPFDKTSENHFYVANRGNIEVDLDNLLSRIKDINGTLDSLSSYLYYTVYCRER